MTMVDGVCVITLDAARTRNALDREMRIALVSALETAIDDDRCTAVVITGAGGHFCAGGNIKSRPVGDIDPEQTKANIALLHDVVRSIVNAPKFIIAAAEGAVYGAGLALACACDFLIASETASFSANFARVGLMADAGLLWSLPQKIGLAATRKMLLAGKVVNGEEALQLGLADEAVSPGTALDVAVARAREYSALAPLSVKLMKQVLGEYPESLNVVLARELEGQPALVATLDYREARSAFSEKRLPLFVGR